MTPDEWDKLSNELLVAGALFAKLYDSGDVRCAVPLLDEAHVTEAALYVWFDFMKSRYRLTVTLDPEEGS